MLPPAYLRLEPFTDVDNTRLMASSLVLVLDRAEGTKPDFSAVRAEVERELMLARRKQALSAMYERLLKNYTVVSRRKAGSRAIMLERDFF